MADNQAIHCIQDLPKRGMRHQDEVPHVARGILAFASLTSLASTNGAVVVALLLSVAPCTSADAPSAQCLQALASRCEGELQLQSAEEGNDSAQERTLSRRRG